MGDKRYENAAFDAVYVYRDFHLPLGDQGRSSISIGGCSCNCLHALDDDLAGVQKDLAEKIQFMTISYDDFQKVDIRLGKIIEVQDFPEAHKPAFKLTIDFGPEIGTKHSSVQAVGAHTKEELQDMLVICVLNFEPKQIGPFTSEVLTLGFRHAGGTGWVLATPGKTAVHIGDRLQ